MRRPKPMVIGEQVCYRTQLMTETEAEAFKRCITANNTRFHSVMVNRSEKAKGRKAHYVSFAPIDTARKAALVELQRDGRRARAADRLEAGTLLFWQDPDQRWIYRVYSTISQETYAVTDHDCECWDYLARCKKLHIPCIHMEALTIWKIAQDSLAPYPEREAGDISPQPAAHVQRTTRPGPQRPYEEPLTRAEMDEINDLLHQG